VTKQLVESPAEVIIRQNATIIRRLESINSWLVAIALILIVPIAIGLLLLFFRVMAPW
jgi:hypothetical protein